MLTALSGRRDLWGLHEMRPHVSYRAILGLRRLSGDRLSCTSTTIGSGRVASRSTPASTSPCEGVREPFQIAEGRQSYRPIPTSTPKRLRWCCSPIDSKLPLSFETSGPLSAVSSAAIASKPLTRPCASAAATPSLPSSAGAATTSSLPGGDFETNLGRLASCPTPLPPSFSVQALVQYNDRADVLSTNLRFGWLQQANSGLFVVYNERQDLQDEIVLDSGEPERSVIIKYSRLIDLLR